MLRSASKCDFDGKVKSIAIRFLIVNAFLFFSVASAELGNGSFENCTPTPTPTCDETYTPTPQPTATSTATPTIPAPTPTIVAPTSTPIPTPSLIVPTVVPSPTPLDVLAPLGCETSNVAEVIASLDFSAEKILKVSKRMARLLKRYDEDQTTLAFSRKTIATLQALNSQAWTQAWSIPGQITTNCISYSTDLCKKIDLTPLVDLYNGSVLDMNRLALKLNRTLGKRNKIVAKRLALEVRKSLSESLTTSETLKVETIECTQ